MLKASAPQKSTRKGSCSFAVVLDSRTPRHLLLDGNHNGLREWRSRGGIGFVVDSRSEVGQICWTLIGQARREV